MSAAARIVAIAVCVGLAGCSSQSGTENPQGTGKGGPVRMAKGPNNGKHDTKKCETGGDDKCTVIVIVDATTTPPSLTMNDPDWAVSVKKNKTAAFTWELQTPTGGSVTNYSFSPSNPSGIDFGDPSALAPTVISCSPVTGRPDQYHCDVTHSVQGLTLYKYTVNVVDSSSAKLPALDPWVVGE